ncbi:MAG: GNAT family N-acetyltransferase [Candidatus Babeliales bacterium]
MKKIVILLLTSLFCANALLFNAAEPAIEIETKVMMPGVHSYQMHTITSSNKSKQIEIIGAASVVYGDMLAPSISPLVDNLDLSAAPAALIELRTMLKTVQKNYIADFKGMAMIGDLWINPAHRGKGLAKELIQHVCQKLHSEGIRFIVLTPDPFEYVDGVQKSLRGTSEYEEKRQRLIQLYQQLGFALSNETEPLFMYLAK